MTRDAAASAQAGQGTGPLSADLVAFVQSGITVLNAPGTIDSDYRGEVRVPLINLGDEAFTVERGMRIAQLVIAPVVQAGFGEVTDLSETERGAGGFGSTGV